LFGCAALNKQRDNVDGGVRTAHEQLHELLADAIRAQASRPSTRIWRCWSASCRSALCDCKQPATADHRRHNH
jgi:hypothetical protein